VRLRSIVAIATGQTPSEDVLASSADAILVTVADASNDLAEARQRAAESISAITSAGKLALVRVNHPRTQLLRDDLDMLVSPGLAGVLVSHTTNPQDVRDTTVLLREIELRHDSEPGTVALFPVIDTARGLLRCADIIEAAPRVGGVLFDGEAYARDVSGRAEENGPRLAYARGKIVASARAFDKLPLVCSSGLEMRFLAQHGFAGLVIEDARVAQIANQVFTPGLSARKRAERHRDAYVAARAEGAWVARVGAEVADSHSARKAAQTLNVSEPSE
jgi:citrate lyase subunit beta / citryl-CoA lyase